MTLQVGDPELVARSPGGAFWLETRRGQGRGGAGYRLLLREGAKELWTLELSRVTRQQPSALFVSDFGWSVVHARGHLVVISPKGESVLSHDVVGELVANLRSSRYVHFYSHGGPGWAGRSRAWFPVLDGCAHFCVRTWWGERILLDLERARRTSDEPHHGALERDERAWALEALASVTRHARALELRRRVPIELYATLEELLSAITLAGRAGLAEAEPLLRPFELLRAIDRGISPPFWWSSIGFVDGYGFRAEAALALRRLGARPRGFATYAFHRGGDPGSELIAEIPECVGDLERRAREVAPRLPAEDVLRLFGSPDFVMHREPWAWDLGVDATLRVRFNWRGRVASCETVRPPDWTRDERERTWIH